MGDFNMKTKLKRIFVALIGMPAMLVTLISVPVHPIAMAQEAAKSPKAESRGTRISLTVLNPQGTVKKNRDLAPRLETLKGKKIAMWLSSTPGQLYAGKGDELYDALAKMLKEKFAGITIVPYTDLPMKFMPENEVVAAITAAKPDAVVAAFGG
jgi:hypothetical protein